MFFSRLHLHWKLSLIIGASSPSTAGVSGVSAGFELRGCAQGAEGFGRCPADHDLVWLFRRMSQNLMFFYLVIAVDEFASGCFCLFQFSAMDVRGDCPQFVSMVNSAIQILLSAKAISSEGDFQLFEVTFLPFAI